MNSIILTASTRLLVVMLLVFSVFMLLRGHNEPGGGFIGGLIAATGFVIYAIGCGTSAARHALRVSPENLSVFGLGLALIAGLLPFVFDEALFKGQWVFFGATAEDKGISISSVLLFDIGVYLVVMGAILSLVFTLEESV